MTDIPSRQAREQEQYDILILASVGVAPRATSRFDFKIKPTLIPVAIHDGDQAIIDTISVTTWRGRTDTDAEGRVEVTGYGRRANENGESVLTDRWRSFPLTPELAAPLLLAAMTRSPVAPRRSTQEGDAS